MANILSGAGIIDKMANNKRPAKIIKVLDFVILILKLFRNSDLEIRNFAANHFKKIIAASIRQVLKLSNVAVSGMAIKNGIERTKNKVAFSSEANNT